MMFYDALWFDGWYLKTACYKFFAKVGKTFKAKTKSNADCRFES